MWVLVAVLAGVALVSGVSALAAALRAPSATAAAALGALLLVTFAGGWLRYAFVPGHHAMYLDEPWYEEAACRVARSGQMQLCSETWVGARCESYAKAPGWPLLLAPLKWWTGCAGSAGIVANRLLGTASLPLVAAAARGAGASPWGAVGAALLLAVHPSHVEWSATAETNVAAAFATLVGLCAALTCLRRRRGIDVVLAASAFGLATAIRPESLVATLAAAAVVATAGGPLRRRGSMAAAIAGAGAVAALASLSLWSMNAAISGGGFLSLANIAARLGELDVTSASPHLAIAALAALGLPAVARRRGTAAALLLAFAALCGALIVLAYDRFAERMLLAPTLAALPAVALVGGGGGATRARRIVSSGAAAALLAVFALAAGRRVPLLASPPETQLLETRLAARLAQAALAADALFIAPQPSVLAAVGIRPVMSAAAALADEERLVAAVGSARTVYFLRDMYCEPGFASGGEAARCARILERFAAHAVVEERRNVRRYVLYELALADAGGARGAGVRR
jgi:hypothetical protein